jgi:hypothetical protein
VTGSTCNGSGVCIDDLPQQGCPGGCIDPGPLCLP